MSNQNQQFTDLIVYDRYHSDIDPSQSFSIQCYNTDFPYIVSLEYGLDEIHLSAISYSTTDDQPSVLELIELPFSWFKESCSITLVWNAKSPKLALLIDHRFKLILDFESECILSNLQSLGSQMNWKPIRLDSQPKILDEFEEERLRIQNEELSQLIKGFQEDPSHYQRLKLFRSIMTSSFLIPISEPETDPAHMFLTFPKDQHQLLCTFTDVEAAKQNLGDELHFKRVPAQFLF